MQQRRTKRWWKERWVRDNYAVLRTPELLAAHMRHKNFSISSFAYVVDIERKRESRKGVSRQMISYLANGRVKSCEPDLAAAIERVLDVPERMLFDVVPKSRENRQTVKSDAA